VLAVAPWAPGVPLPRAPCAGAARRPAPALRRAATGGSGPPPRPSPCYRGEPPAAPPPHCYRGKRPAAPPLALLPGERPAAPPLARPRPCYRGERPAAPPLALLPGGAARRPAPRAATGGSEWTPGGLPRSPRTVIAPPGVAARPHHRRPATRDGPLRRGRLRLATGRSNAPAGRSRPDAARPPPRPCPPRAAAPGCPLPPPLLGHARRGMTVAPAGVPRRPRMARPPRAPAGPPPRHRPGTPPVPLRPTARRFPIGREIDGRVASVPGARQARGPASTAAFPPDARSGARAGLSRPVRALRGPLSRSRLPPSGKPPKHGRAHRNRPGPATAVPASDPRQHEGARLLVGTRPPTRGSTKAPGSWSGPGLRPAAARRGRAPHRWGASPGPRIARRGPHGPDRSSWRSR
jgi:hypothetical protein